MHRHSLGVRNVHKLRKRLQGPHFVIAVSHRKQDRVRTNTLGQCLRMHTPQAIHRQIGKLKSILFQRSTRIQHGGVLNASGDDVVAARAVAVGITADREVDSFGAATGEDEVERIRRPDQSGDMLTGVLDGYTRLATLAMDAGGISPYRRVVGNGGLKCLGQQRCRGIVVEVDALHSAIIIRIGHRPDLEAIPRASIA
jgi:hypothetical protein